MAIAGVMHDAGLTVGGFYAHFTSKDDLVAETIAVAFDESLAALAGVAANRTPRAALRAIVERYLSTAQRDARTTGCPISKITSDLPRLSIASRRSYARGIARFAALLAERLRALDVRDADALASSVLAEMVGALSLARALPDGMSDDVLARSRAHLVARLGLARA